MELNKKLEELKPYQLNCNVFDVYSYNGLSMQELLCQFFTAINNCVNLSNKTLDLANWLINEGLEHEVVKKLMVWLEDGTLEELINVTLFDELNSSIDNISSQLEISTYYITPEMFGAKCDGYSDDTISIINCFNYAISNNRIVKFNGMKTYIVSSQITITEHLNIDFNGATIKVSSNCAELVNVIFINQTLESNNNIVGYYLNLNINCNNNAKIGFTINNGKKGKLDNIEVFNANDCGFYIKTSHELAITNIRSENCDVCLRTESTDVNFRGIYARSCRICVQNLGASNFYSDVHGWTDEKTYPGSIFFEISKPCIINNSYSDTYETSYKYNVRSTIIVNNIKYMWNEELVSIGNKPTLFDFGNFPQSSDTLIITNNYVDGALAGVTFSKQNIDYTLAVRVDDSNLFFRVEGFEKGIKTMLSLQEGFTVVDENITKKDNRVNVVMKLERTGLFLQNKQVIPFIIVNEKFHPSTSSIFNGFYSIDDGFSVDGIIYGQLASNGDFRFKYPKVESTSTTKLYVYLNFSYDV